MVAESWRGSGSSEMLGYGVLVSICLSSLRFEGNGVEGGGFDVGGFRVDS